METLSNLQEKLKSNQRSGKPSYLGMVTKLEKLANEKNVGLVFYKTNGHKFSYSATLVAYDRDLPFPVRSNAKNVLIAIDVRMSESGIISSLYHLETFLNNK